MGGLWTIPKGTVKNDRKRQFCVGYIEISLCEFITGVCATFGKYLGVHTPRKFENHCLTIFV